MKLPSQLAKAFVVLVAAASHHASHANQPRWLTDCEAKRVRQGAAPPQAHVGCVGERQALLERTQKQLLAEIEKSLADPRQENRNIVTLQKAIRQSQLLWKKHTATTCEIEYLVERGNGAAAGAAWCEFKAFEQRNAYLNNVLSQLKVSD
jgi:hypothetical protein